MARTARAKTPERLLGAFLRKKRESVRMRQVEVAQQMSDRGIPTEQQRISLIENGKGFVTGTELIYLAEILRFDLNEVQPSKLSS